MNNKKSSWKDNAVSEYYAHSIASGYVMARSGDWKYTDRTVMDDQHPAQRELYNLAVDPHEFTNLAGLPEHSKRIEEMHQRMVKEVGGDPDETEQRARHDMAKGYGRTDRAKKPPVTGTWGELKDRS